ncbi:hypothetical protein BJP40_06500 [Streptomyces sp. CC53]|uniref:hypothetical protein n=1 Tax=Streptomyces sp. CC53 TaxID=1906740 RepID=UPI0008DE4126|nr:hypothetical protein [Streptomyces sp. CC53]OII61172.1 hypothetical protein BJP40_06500 [Streptomyces sp. CC53]
MRIELRKASYQVTFEALDWLCVAERMEDWSMCHPWPEAHDAGRLAVAAWARAMYDGAAISHHQRFTLTMPRDWAVWLWQILAMPPHDEFPWELAPQLLGQIKAQNRQRQ